MRCALGSRPSAARAPARAARAARTMHRVRVVPCVAHGTESTSGPATGTVVAEEKNKGFIGEMRRVAMKLHTREQAPKEGGVEAPKPQKAFEPTVEGYLRFLVESKAVYEALEVALKDAKHPEYAAFQSTGLERTEALAKDIAWLSSHAGVPVPTPAQDGPGATYAALLREAASADPPVFICHFYNFYFAHTAGGRMIGSKVAQLLNLPLLEFYKWDGDVQMLLDNVRRSINELAQSWSEEQRAHCLQETASSFKYSGAIMGVMMN